MNNEPTTHDQSLRYYPRRGRSFPSRPPYPRYRRPRYPIISPIIIPIPGPRRPPIAPPPIIGPLPPRRPPYIPVRPVRPIRPIRPIPPVWPVPVRPVRPIRPRRGYRRPPTWW